MFEPETGLSANDPIANLLSFYQLRPDRSLSRGVQLMNPWAYLVLPIALTACTEDTDEATDSMAQDVARSIDKAPYAPVNEPDAPTVASLEATGYVRADYFPVGCIIPEEPEAMCDATGAEFMDQSGKSYEDYDQYEYVCPAIDGVELAEWKCRKQLQSDS